MSDAPQDVPKNDSSRDIAKAGLHGRALLAGGIVLAIALVAAFQFYAIPLLNATASHASASDAIATARNLFIGVAGFGMLTAAVWILYALRILRHRQDPPPGAWLWRDTKIVRGEQAVRRAWLSIAAAVLTCAACLGLVAYIVLALGRLATPTPLPTGIDIVSQKTSPPASAHASK